MQSIEHKLFSAVIPNPTKDVLNFLDGIGQLKFEKVETPIQQEHLVHQNILQHLVEKNSKEFTFGNGDSHIWIRGVKDGLYAINRVTIYTELRDIQHHKEFLKLEKINYQERKNANRAKEGKEVLMQLLICTAKERYGERIEIEQIENQAIIKNIGLVNGNERISRLFELFGFKPKYIENDSYLIEK